MDGSAIAMVFGVLIYCLACLFLLQKLLIINSRKGILVTVKRLHPDAVIPKYAKPGDAGSDLTAISKHFDEEKRKFVFDFGLALEIPPGYVGLIFPRSSNNKTELLLSNSVGVIDSQYRGSIKAFFTPLDISKKNYDVGDRVCQLIIIPYPEIMYTEVSELSDTDRGSGGFGSTGS
jgi:dUTP pyrophosphatase